MQRPDLGLGGVVQVDGCTIGGHRVAENTTDEFGKRQKYENRRVVVVMREPFGNTKAFVGKKESDSLPAIVETVAPDSLIHADGSKGWNGLSRLYQVERIPELAPVIETTVLSRPHPLAASQKSG